MARALRLGQLQLLPSNRCIHPSAPPYIYPCDQAGSPGNAGAIRSSGRGVQLLYIFLYFFAPSWNLRQSIIIKAKGMGQRQAAEEEPEEGKSLPGQGVTCSLVPTRKAEEMGRWGWGRGGERVQNKNAEHWTASGKE